MRARFFFGWMLLVANVVVAATSSGDSSPPVAPRRLNATKPPSVFRNDAAAADVAPENVKAAAIVYFAAQLEELEVFAVADKIASLFAQGLLPLGGSKRDGGVANAVTDYRRAAAQRLDADARRSLYTQLLGGKGAPNQEFDLLFARYAEAIESAGRDGRERAGRALAGHLARRYGAGFEAAAKLAMQVAELERLLEDPEVKEAFGAKDMWGVVDAVATKHLGSAKTDRARLRSRATNGRKLLEALATPEIEPAALKLWATEWRRSAAAGRLTLPAPPIVVVDGGTAR